MATDETLGGWLRRKRNEKKLGLREAAAKAGITHGYLSQLESDKVKEPAPQVLQKLADAYDEPFMLLMQVAGYIENDPARLSPNQTRALKIVGDPTDGELKAIRAVLDAIRRAHLHQGAASRIRACGGQGHRRRHGGGDRGPAA